MLWGGGLCGVLCGIGILPTRTCKPTFLYCQYTTRTPPPHPTQTFITHITSHSIPPEREDELPSLLKDLEANASTLGINDMQMSLTSLEEVFLNIAKKVCVGGGDVWVWVLCGCGVSSVRLCVCAFGRCMVVVLHLVHVMEYIRYNLCIFAHQHAKLACDTHTHTNTNTSTHISTPPPPKKYQAEIEAAKAGGTAFQKLLLDTGKEVKVPLGEEVFVDQSTGQQYQIVWAQDEEGKLQILSHTPIEKRSSVSSDDVASGSTAGRA